MKYILIHETKNDCFCEEYETKKAAIAAGVDAWYYLTDYDKKKTSAFYVLKSANPDPDSDNHYDGDFVKIWKRDGLTFDYTIEIACYNEGYSHTETFEVGNTKEIFSACDWFESLDDTECFEKYRCIEIIARFWVSGSDKVYTDPVNADSYDVYF